MTVPCEGDLPRVPPHSRTLQVTALARYLYFYFYFRSAPIGVHIWVNQSSTKSPQKSLRHGLPPKVMSSEPKRGRQYLAKSIGTLNVRSSSVVVKPSSRPRYVKGSIIPLDPPPPKEGVDNADYIPEMTASWFSLLTFGWMNSLMALGYARPLEASDLWKLQEHRSSEVIANAILNSFEARRKKADEYNTRLANGEINPPLRLRLMSALRGNREERLRQWVLKDGRKQPSLIFAINDSIKWWFWSSGMLKVAADTAQVTNPLILKVRPFRLLVYFLFLTQVPVF